MDITSYGLEISQLSSSGQTIKMQQRAQSTTDFARSGFLQAIIIAFSAIWLLYRLHKTPIIEPNPTAKHRMVKWPYELLSQASRTIALIFLSAAYVEGHIHILDFAGVTYALILGLIRLSADIYLRRTGLHHVNFVLTALLLTLATAQLLPCTEIGTSQCSTQDSTTGAIVSLTISVLLASITPREWGAVRDNDVELCDRAARRDPAPEETCSWMNYYCTYSWLSPLIWNGITKKLDMASIPTIPWYDEPRHLLRKILAARSVSKTTFRTILRYQRNELFSMAILIASSSFLENMTPFAMLKLLEYVSHPETATNQPWTWLVLMFTTGLARSMLFQQYVFVSTRFIVRLKSGMVQEIYHRALNSAELDERLFDSVGKTKGAGNPGPSQDEKSTSTSRLMNLMSTDIDAIQIARNNMIGIVGLPITGGVSLIGLFMMLGWASLIGIAIMVFATPISVLLGRVVYKIQRRVRKAQENRIATVTEYLSSVQTIKYLAWEDNAINKIAHSRTSEQKGLWRIAVFQTITDVSAQVLPYLGLLVMFGLHVGVQKRRLDAATAFTVIVLVKNMQRNLTVAGSNSRKFTAAIVALKRLDGFFQGTRPFVRHRIGPLSIKHASFRQHKTATFRLQNISLDFAQGGINIITGPSGSGKSTLLLSILGETYMESGHVTAPMNIAFASQSAWIQRGTIQDHILFYSPMDRARYEIVIGACCLTADLEQMPKGDSTSVGDSGTSLSGGQMARIALARALYSISSLLLLDDIFAALDTKTSAAIWKNFVLVTQVSWMMSQADLIISLGEGCVKGIDVNAGAIRREVVMDQDSGYVNAPSKTRTQPGTSTEDLHATTSEEVSAKQIINQELQQTAHQSGRLTSFQYMKYFGSPILIAMCLFSSLVAHGTVFVSGYWVSIWVEAYQRPEPVDVAHYMGIYALFTLMAAISAGASMLSFQWGGWLAAKRLHGDFISAIMSAPLSWLKSVPIGRLTNRSSTDISSIDRNLSSMLNSAFSESLTLLLQIIAVSSVLPLFFLPVVFPAVLGIIVSEMYTRTAVTLRRLALAGQSPVFSHFTETLSALPIIRAREESQEAVGDALAIKIKVWPAAAEANFNINRWVAFRVNFITSVISLSAGIIALSKIGVIGAGLVGFSLQNATGLSRSILALVTTLNSLEIEMQSFIRVKEYIKLEPEGAGDDAYAFEQDHNHVAETTPRIPMAWPQSGEVEFRNATVRYDPDGDDILTDINLKVRAGERVAIVGRTGSGKTTLMLSLLRFTHVVSGKILYDGIDIAKMPRRSLRQSLTIIPQEAALFSGTVQSNLDPTGAFNLENIKAVLNSCMDIATGDELDGSHGHSQQQLSLTSEINVREENLSHGQRQILSLCRALLRQSKLILLDEATASMDRQSDEHIQKIIRKDVATSTNGRTLVTIAHRLRTIIDYDTVVVMGAGNIIEQGSPRDLYNSGGQFYEMLYHSRELDEFQRLLKV